MTRLDSRSIDDRREIIGILRASRRGHVGSAFSILEIVRVLYDDVLRHDPRSPCWSERDRFILSKGHGCLALYVTLARKGIIPKEELGRFCGFGAMLGGHPEFGKNPGIEASTGALGHGLSFGVGMALAARIDRAAWRVFVLLGDGECDEGSVWEAAMSAGKHKLDHLTAIVDYNKMQSYGPTREVQDLEPLAAKWQSFGFAVREVDGHDVEALRGLLTNVPFERGRPGVLICHTVKGKGIRSIENVPEWHHKTQLKPEELDVLAKELEAGS
jgi:transketolase